MTTVSAYRAPPSVFKSWLSTGQPNAFGTVTTYGAGTTTPVATWTDWTATTPNSNPQTLNARGEMPMFLLPNVAYKIVEADQFGNQINSADQVYNNNLLSLYGGVDSGSVNAYVLNFIWPYSALQNGIIIYWIPANTNTGPSTLTVNSTFGTQPIINQNGSSVGI